MDTEVQELFVCCCGDVEHQLIMSYFNDDDYPEVYAAVHLNIERSFWKRVGSAFKYIFGYKCKYGHFDEFIFKPKDYKRLQTVVNYLKDAYDKEEERNKAKANSKDNRVS